jgi:hypothetical protein
MDPMRPLLADVGRRPCCAIGPPGISPVRFSGCRGLVSSVEGSSPGGLPVSQRSALGCGPVGCGAGYPLIYTAGTRPRRVGFSRAPFLQRDNISGIPDNAIAPILLSVSPRIVWHLFLESPTCSPEQGAFWPGLCGHAQARNATGGNGAWLSRSARRRYP